MVVYIHNNERENSCSEFRLDASYRDNTVPFEILDNAKILVFDEKTNKLTYQTRDEPGTKKESFLYVDNYALFLSDEEIPGQKPILEVDLKRRSEAAENPLSCLVGTQIEEMELLYQHTVDQECNYPINLKMICLQNDGNYTFYQMRPMIKDQITAFRNKNLTPEEIIRLS